jgi:DNA-binding transcriptional ArsR family regulator
MRDAKAAAAFGALGNRSRLAVLRLLVKAGADGLNVTAIRAATRMPASTLAHHLAALADAGLVRQEKQGRETISRADYDTIRNVTDFLMEDCCTGAFACRDADAA